MLIDILELQCPKKVCEIIDGSKNILYLDDTHFSLEGIDLMGSKIKARYPDLLEETD